MLQNIKTKVFNNITENKTVLADLKQLVAQVTDELRLQTGQATDYENMITRMRKELKELNSQINNLEKESKIKKSLLERQKSQKTLVHRRANSLVMLRQSEENLKATSVKENNLNIKYYGNVILRKKAFVQEQEQRKLRQREIAMIAMNDNEDKQETVKRNILLFLRNVNRVYQQNMDEQLLKNTEFEAVFREISNITVRF